jgi:hypothetical protein
MKSRSTSRKKSKRSKKNRIIVVIQKSTRPEKKYMVTIDDSKTIHFGAKNYSDYTKHKNKSRMLRYRNRHKSRENWGKSGIYSAGFWSLWILWNKPSFIDSIKDTEKRFNIKIIYTK